MDQQRYHTDVHMLTLIANGQFEKFRFLLTFKRLFYSNCNLTVATPHDCGVISNHEIIGAGER